MTRPNTCNVLSACIKSVGEGSNSDPVHKGGVQTSRLGEIWGKSPVRQSPAKRSNEETTPK
eukprot:CAMPEP_0173106386 /NCGR_PEP_ID=MMETSP1102-20130122/40940_1 /TAXON_ID=49646 /ORGANISM="Geminigera sp., Strain Caron Lab Isolate" /LENGTH=60 /DNA_ID=CAMNT_0014003353 /DNA_START=613 /DNA_END=792 /DNA_ORIENTATION=-